MQFKYIFQFPSEASGSSCWWSLVRFEKWQLGHLHTDETVLPCKVQLYSLSPLIRGCWWHPCSGFMQVARTSQVSERPWIISVLRHTYCKHFFTVSINWCPNFQVMSSKWSYRLSSKVDLRVLCGANSQYTLG